jgi:hypothetical protein
MMGMIEDIRDDRKSGMPDLGGWAWFGGRDDLYLATNHGGRRYVMGFKRKGMRSAQPTFQIGGIMHGAIDDLTEYAVGDGAARGQAEADKDPSVYRMDVKSVDHPDARRIARVPDMEAALLAAEELATDLMITANNAADAAKTDPRWEVVAEKLRARLATYRAATGGAA